MTESELRTKIADAAISELGKTDPEPYWQAVLTKEALKGKRPKHWCGAFWLAMLKEKGVALDVMWLIGGGAELAMRRASKPITYTRDPEPGDLAYFTAKQHHAVIVKVEGQTVELMNGNGEGGRVTKTRRLVKDIPLIYSINALVAEAIRESAPERDTDAPPNPRAIKNT